ncbi:MAG TPA: tripartite tricarboxylate transporter TctB family protein [Burkholderiaceae bacterium]|nr:tripartite tricarboxylate transporter TctB family protein [Burkholderiaceae bacterium]
MKERLRLVLPHTVLLLIAGLLYYAASLIDTSGAGGTRIGPDFWPKVIIGAMAALCIYEIGKRLISGNTHDAAGLIAGLDSAPLEIEGTPATAEASVTTRAQSGHRELVAGLVVIATFVFGVAYVGFFVGTALFLALFSWIGGYRRALPVVLVSIIGAFVLLVLFMRIAYISLPLGAGPFQQLSVLLLRLIGV